jgi:hypothetical protein
MGPPLCGEECFDQICFINFMGWNPMWVFVSILLMLPRLWAYDAKAGGGTLEVTIMVEWRNKIWFRGKH